MKIPNNIAYSVYNIYDPVCTIPDYMYTIPDPVGTILCQPGVLYS